MTDRSKDTKNIWMEDSRRESRVPTSSKPSSRESEARKVNPRSWVKNVSQYLIRRAPPINLFLFSIVMVFGIGEFTAWLTEEVNFEMEMHGETESSLSPNSTALCKNEAISRRLVYVLDLRTFSTLFIKSCGLKGLVM